MNIIIAAMAFVAIFTAGDARAFDGTTSTDRPSPSWGYADQRRLGLILTSVTARRFRTDCPTFVQIDQQRLDRVAKLVDELVPRRCRHREDRDVYRSDHHRDGAEPQGAILRHNPPRDRTVRRVAMNDDPLIVSWLEDQARANAGIATTGVAADGDIAVHYYPVSDRFT